MTLENRKKIIHKKKIKKFVNRTHLTPYSHHKQSTTVCIIKGWEYAYTIKNNGEELMIGLNLEKSDI